MHHHTNIRPIVRSQFTGSLPQEELRALQWQAQRTALNRIRHPSLVWQGWISPYRLVDSLDGLRMENRTQMFTPHRLVLGNKRATMSGF